MYRSYEEPIGDTVERYLASIAPPYIPKLKTPVKTLNDFLEQALKTIYDAPGGYIEHLVPWVDEMVDKKGKKRLKKILEIYEDTCGDLGIVDFNQFRALYYLLAVVVKQV